MKHGLAGLPREFPGLGSHPLSASYSGDANVNGSNSAALVQVVNRAPTTTVLVSSLNPAYVGQPVTFTISVVPSFSGTPTGTAILYKGSTKFATLALSNGLVSCGLPV